MKEEKIKIKQVEIKQVEIKRGASLMRAYAISDQNFRTTRRRWRELNLIGVCYEDGLLVLFDTQYLPKKNVEKD